MTEQQIEALLNSGKAIQLKPEHPEPTEEISFDNLCDLALAAGAKKKEAEKAYNELKAKLKKGLTAKGLDSYENPNGVKVYYVSKQLQKQNKELIRELLGKDYARCIHYEESKSFFVK